MLMRILLPLYILIAISTSADARHIEYWSYNKLSNRADVIVVATLISTNIWDQSDDPPKLGDVVFAGRLSTLEIKGVLKGDLPTSELELVHYGVAAIGTEVAPGVKVIHSRPNVIIFGETAQSLPGPVTARAKHNSRAVGQPHYLLFLRQRKDGKFEPASGQVDSACSVMLLQPEAPARLHDADDSPTTAPTK